MSAPERECLLSNMKRSIRQAKSRRSGVLFTWLVSISGVLAFFAWGTVCLCHIRFRKAMAAQDIPLSTLPWVAPWQPYISYIGLGGAVFFALISGWTSFLKPFGECSKHQYVQDDC